MLDNKQNKNLRVASSHPLGALTAEEAFLWEKLDLARLPRHIAVIMDGNGRWAQKRHLPRIAGHRSGTQSARTTIETCARLKIEALTLYAFSVENWRRPKTEIDFLMALLREYLRKVRCSRIASAGCRACQRQESTGVRIAGLLFQRLIERGFGCFVLPLMKFFDAPGDGILRESGCARHEKAQAAMPGQPNAPRHPTPDPDCRSGGAFYRRTAGS